MLEKLAQLGKKKPAPVVIDTSNHEMEARMFTPSTPSVNIIPRSVLNEYEVSALGTRLIAVATIIVVGFASLYAWGVMQTSANDSTLTRVADQTATTQEETASLAGFQSYFNDVENKRSDLLAVLSVDVRMGDIFRAISDAATQNGVTITSMSLAVTSTSATDEATASCPTPDPFGSTGGAGCVTFDGRAGSREAIDAFVNALNEIPGFANAYVPSSSVSEEGSSVSGSVSFNSEFYSQRYDALGIPLETAITDGTGGIGDGETVNAPPAPVESAEPTPSPTPSATPSAPTPSPSAQSSANPTVSPSPGGGA